MRFLFLLILLSLDASAQSIAREPYIQRASDDAVIIRWRTDTATDSRVKYGLAVDLLNQQLDNTSVGVEHRVEISGLAADTKYFYSVGSTSMDLTVSDGSYFFNTNPTPGTVKDTRIWVLGDSGRGNANAHYVKNGYLTFISDDKKADLWLMLGDNAYNNGLDNEYTTGLFDVYPEILRNTVLWPTLGNHDGYAKYQSPYLEGQEIPYYASFSLPRNAEVGGVASGTESYYSFDYGNIHFICLNSYDDDRSVTASMASWLAEDIAATDKTWKIAFWHHPPYSKGSHDSDTEIELVEMRENILPILESNGVDLVLAGHSHSYERSYLIDGHYDTSDTFVSEMLLNGESGESGYFKPALNLPNQGTIYVVNGVGATAGAGNLDHPIMHYSISALGSMIIDINGQELLSKLIDPNGNILDTFMINKSLQSYAASSTNVTKGLIEGALVNTNAEDDSVQVLKSKKYKGTPKFSGVYQIEMPVGNFQKYLEFRAYKNRRAARDFRILYSADGSNFIRLTDIRSAKKSSEVKRFALNGIQQGRMFVKFKMMNAGDSNAGSKLFLDLLRVVNQ